MPATFTPRPEDLPEAGKPLSAANPLANESPTISLEEAQGGREAPLEISPAEAYFDEDEEYLAGHGEILLETHRKALIQGLQGAISWELVNFLDENDKPRGRASLRLDPPVLRITSSDATEAEFVVTQELAATLQRAFADVERAYFGLSPKRLGDDPTSNERIKTTLEAMSLWIHEHKVQLGITAFLILALVVIGVF